ncbi:MAG: hypothetical protein ACRCZP_16290 [Phycicoccus sp.]
MTGTEPTLAEVRALADELERDRDGDPLAGARQALRVCTAQLEQAHDELTAVELERDAALLDRDELAAELVRVRAAADATARRLAEVLVDRDGIRARVLTIAELVTSYPSRDVARELRAAVRGSSS